MRCSAALARLSAPALRRLVSGRLGSAQVAAPTLAPSEDGTAGGRLPTIALHWRPCDST
jgi:hypothetical protein